MSILSPKHAVWLAGFRPFFLMATVMGILIPSLWGFVFSGKFVLPPGINPLQWHAHEMLFGFGGAVLFGFLLTASKNWVKVRGIHGTGLMVLSGLWLFERFFYIYSQSVHPVIKHIGLSLFVISTGYYIARTLIKNRKNDSFSDNYFFLFLLTLIILAKNLLVSEIYYQHGIAMSLGLFRLAFVVMFERTIPQFMKNTEGTILYRNAVLDFSIKALVATSVFQSFLPSGVSAVMLGAAASLLFLRWLLWRPDIGFRKFGNAAMYIGYLGLTLHFLFEVLRLSGAWTQAAFSIHIFTFLCMGVVIPSMIIRISNGHTGRKPQFHLWEKSIICSILIASIFRLVLTLIWPGDYLNWIMMAGLLWSLAYIILIIRVAPFLLAPRIDGKVH